MKKIILISLITFLFLQENAHSQTSTIWFLRSKSMIGSAVGCDIKIGNQKPFKLQVGQSAKFSVQSKGRVVITASILGIGGRVEEEWLEVEPGKEYFYKINVNKKKFFYLEEKPEKEDWTKKPKLVLEEDAKYPINR